MSAPSPNVTLVSWAVRAPGPVEAEKWLAGETPGESFWAPPPGTRFERLYLGNEFCELRLPTAPELSRTLALCQAAGVPLTLLTPLLCDKGLAKLARLLDKLPEGSEVVCSDWGVLHEIRESFPHLDVVVGRTLIRAFKEPRVPRGQGPTLAQSDLALPAFPAMLRSLGISRVETDLPPDRLGLDLSQMGLRGSLHVPFGHVAWGRACMVGSLHLPVQRKFQPGAPCRQECREILAELRSEGLPVRLFHRGNTAFALHPPESLSNLAGLPGIDRLVYDPALAF